MSPQDVLRLYGTKPRIRRTALGHGQWECLGQNLIGLGSTPRAAYIAWRLRRDASLMQQFEHLRFAPTPYPRPPYDITCSTAH